MPLRSLKPKLEVLDVDGTEIHAIKPTKGAWDEYIDASYERDENGEIQIKGFKGLRNLYKTSIKKITNVDIETDNGVVHKDVITDSDEIVNFLLGLNDLEAGRKIDSWLMSLGELGKAAEKN